MSELRTSGRPNRNLLPHAVLALLAGLFLCLSAAPAATAACLPNPSACGFPDETNTGVPPGTTLTPSGSRTVSTDGAVLSGLDITGTVTVAADNVTIEDSRIVKTSGGSGSYAVILNDGADDFTIKDTEVAGPESNTSGLESAVWNHYNNPGATATGVYFHRCADCWEGAGTFRDDYMVVDAAYTGSHDEDIYVCGTTVNVDHSTLVNTHQQTATVFGDTICGGNDYTVTDSLLAGGGFVLYPQANSDSEVGSTNISDNRIARCQTSAVYNSGSGGTACSGGADAFGYYPLGGYYGVSAYTYSGPDQIWQDNVWDDTSQPLCDNGKPGCGAVSPPPEEAEPPEEEPSPPEEPEAEPPEEPSPPEEPESPEEPSPPNPPNTPVEAVWTPPAEAEVGVPVTLDGTESEGNGPLLCTWSFEDRTGNTVWETKTGCELPYVFEVADEKYVTLTVTDSDGEADSSRHSFPVSSSEPEPPAEPESPEPPTEPEPPANPGPPEERDSSPGQTPPPSRQPGAVERAQSAPAAGGGATTSPIQASWRLPSDAHPGDLVTLMAGEPAGGPQPAGCNWTVASGMPSQVYRRHPGCTLAFRMPRIGIRYVTLTVSDRLGRSDRLERVISGPHF